MMAAEQWHEYQENYKKYGLDMKPAQVKIEKTKARTVISSKDKVRLLALLIFVGALCIGLVITSAYAAAIQYNINIIIEENNAVTGEIENLDVKIQTATNIQTIEYKAVTELGMVRPMPTQVVYIAAEEEPAGDFASVLIEQAYN